MLISLSHSSTGATSNAHSPPSIANWQPSHSQTFTSFSHIFFISFYFSLASLPYYLINRSDRHMLPGTAGACTYLHLLFSLFSPHPSSPSSPPSPLPSLLLPFLTISSLSNPPLSLFFTLLTPFTLSTLLYSFSSSPLSTSFYLLTPYYSKHPKKTFFFSLPYHPAPPYIARPQPFNSRTSPC